MSFPINLQSSQPSLQLLPSTHPHEGARPRGASGQENPATNDSSMPPIKLGPNGLAEDQPPTAQGKLRTRVYVACLQWFGTFIFMVPDCSQHHPSSRSRKIRCDGAKPKCQKCVRRSSDCDYDAAPKRRGPDKKPGARQRTSKKAKLAKEEEAGKQELLSAATIAHEPEHSDANGQDGTNRKRRKACSSVPSSKPVWNAEGEDLDSRRGSTVTSSCSTEGAAPATPRDVTAVTLELTSITDISEYSTPAHQEKAEANILDRLDTISHLVSLTL